MQISIFTTVSNPIKRQDPFTEAIQNYLDFADEVIIVEGGNETLNLGNFFNDELEKFDKLKIIKYPWPKEFDWKFIGEQFQRGYDGCTGDVVIRCDLDYFFHEDDIEDIRKFINEELGDSPVAVMPKKQFVLTDRFRVKSLVPMIYNKKFYGDRIKLNSGGDFCQPSLDGKEIIVEEMPIVCRKQYEQYVVVADDTLQDKRLDDRLPNKKIDDGKFYTMNKGICFYNYDFSFKEKEIIKEDFGRFARAWHQEFNKWTLGGPSDQSALDYFIRMMKGRLNGGGWEKCKLEDHPKYIREKIKNLKPEQLGYNLWGEDKNLTK